MEGLDPATLRWVARYLIRAARGWERYANKQPGDFAHLPRHKAAALRQESQAMYRKAREVESGGRHGVEEASADQSSASAAGESLVAEPEVCSLAQAPTTAWAEDPCEEMLAAFRSVVAKLIVERDEYKSIGRVGIGTGGANE